MSEKKNIDRLFQERFKDFEVQPPSASWNAIEKQIDKKKKPRVIPLWWTLGGVAAAIAILTTSLYLGAYGDVDNSEGTFVNSEKEFEMDASSTNTFEDNDRTINNETQLFDEVTNDNSQLVTEDSKVDKESLNTSTQKSKVDNKANAILRKSTLITSGNESSDPNQTLKEKTRKYYSDNPVKKKDANNAVVQKDNSIPLPIKGDTLLFNGENKTITHLQNGVAVQNNPVITDNLNAANKGIKDSMIDSTIAAIDSIKKKSPTLEEIAAQEKLVDSIKENTFKGRWAATTQVGPVYSNSLSGSAINSDVSENSRDAGFNLSYGIGLSYEISPRLSVRTGIHQVNMSYSTQDINYQVDINLFARSQAIPQTYNVDAVRNAGQVNSNSPISNNGIATGFAAQEFTSNEFKGIEGELSQQLGYIEVPLELKYNLINSKFKINILGGMSALFLTDNVVAIQNSNERLDLGEDRNFNEFNQSANFGLGFGYDFTNQLGAFIEPSFKYQLNTLRNNTANFRPYTIGIQSGIMYRF
ncbi:MAG: hypothetical protein ABF274_10090 [Nonlabens sp.]|uniref:hypothetical protein n=1 Tax=Nonlabens sp. TaxID=1888209 RepID=UPI00321B09A4